MTTSDSCACIPQVRQGEACINFIFSSVMSSEVQLGLMFSALRGKNLQISQRLSQNYWGYKKNLILNQKIAVWSPEKRFLLH